jgi:hypothetical protein
MYLRVNEVMPWIFIGLQYNKQVYIVTIVYIIKTGKKIHLSMATSKEREGFEDNGDYK